jgi:hypothetical protein
MARASCSFRPKFERASTQRASPSRSHGGAGWAVTRGFERRRDPRSSSPDPRSGRLDMAPRWVFASKLPSLQTATAPAANYPLALEASPSLPDKSQSGCHRGSLTPGLTCSNWRIALALICPPGEVDYLLACHRVLTGPATEAGRYPTTERRASPARRGADHLLVRTNGTTERVHVRHTADASLRGSSTWSLAAGRSRVMCPSLSDTARLPLFSSLLGRAPHGGLARDVRRAGIPH